MDMLATDQWHSHNYFMNVFHNNKIVWRQALAKTKRSPRRCSRPWKGVLEITSRWRRLWTSDRQERLDDTVDQALVPRQVVRTVGVGKVDEPRRRAQVVLEGVDGLRPARAVRLAGRSVDRTRPQRRAELAILVLLVDELPKLLTLRRPRRHRADLERRLDG